MKLNISLILTLIACIHAFSQETQIYFSADAGDKISLYDNRLGNSHMYGFGIEGSTMYYRSGYFHRWYVGTTSDDGESSQMDLSNSRLFLDSALGIGTKTPNSHIHIRKDTYATLTLEAVDNGVRPANTAMIHIKGYGNRGKGIMLTDTASPYEFFVGELYDRHGIGFGVDTTTNGKSEYGENSALYINTARNVGIGTTTPSHKLVVNGTVRAKEVIVDTGWSDSVFEDTYRLRSLDEVETHIEEHGHLPDVPSAAIVESEGLSVGEAQKIMMQKIEELTLYVIDLKKENEAQQLRIQNLESK